MISELHGGGSTTEALSREGVKAFGTVFVQGDLNQFVFIRPCEICVPKLRSRLERLA